MMVFEGPISRIREHFPVFPTLLGWLWQAWTS
jgi:hypothetical protein